MWLRQSRILSPKGREKTKMVDELKVFYSTTIDKSLPIRERIERRKGWSNTERMNSSNAASYLGVLKMPTTSRWSNCVRYWRVWSWEDGGPIWKIEGPRRENLVLTFANGERELTWFFENPYGRVGSEHFSQLVVPNYSLQWKTTPKRKKTSF